MPTLPVIEFEESTHTYTVDGRIIPSVTTILETLIELEQFGCYVDVTTGQTIPADAIKAAGDYGRATHKSANFYMQGKKVKYPDELKWTILELMRWISDYKIEPVHSEMRGYSSKLDVAGTLDLVCKMGYQTLNIVDFKTAKDAPTVGPQTWAYEQIFREMTEHRGVIKRHVLYLPKVEGKQYRFIELRDNRGDRDMFMSSNYSFKWRRR